MSWTEEKVAKLKELWGKGNTASQIAEIIGGISRNAVIGKAHRLNLSAKIKTRAATSNKNFDSAMEDSNIKAIPCKFAGTFLSTLNLHLRLLLFFTWKVSFDSFKRHIRPKTIHFSHLHFN